MDILIQHTWFSVCLRINNTDPTVTIFCLPSYSLMDISIQHPGFCLPSYKKDIVIQNARGILHLPYIIDIQGTWSYISVIFFIDIRYGLERLPSYNLIDILETIFCIWVWTELLSDGHPRYGILYLPAYNLIDIEDKGFCIPLLIILMTCKMQNSATPL